MASVTLLLLCTFLSANAYWYPDYSNRPISPDEGCYSDFDIPYWATCPKTQEILRDVPCKDLFMSSTPSFPNNFTYYAVCTGNYPIGWESYTRADFWSDIMTVDICEDYWDSCISDDPLSKYNDTLEQTADNCRAVRARACGPNRVVASVIPGAVPSNTSVGAFDWGPYSTVSREADPVSLAVVEMSPTLSANNASNTGYGGAAATTTRPAASSHATTGGMSRTYADMGLSTTSTIGTAAVSSATSTNMARKSGLRLDLFALAGFGGVLAIS